MRLRLFDHMMHAVFERRRLRRAARCRLYTPRAANARRRRVSHRAPALWPHRTDQIRMRVRCAHNREGQIFDLFGPPKSGWGVGPAPGFAVLQLGLVWQAVAVKKAAEEAEKVRSSRALDGFGLRRTASDACSCAEWRHPSCSHSALCRARAVRWRARVRTAGRWGRPRVRSHCCSR